LPGPGSAAKEAYFNVKVPLDFLPHVLFMPMSFLTGSFGMNFFQATVPFEAWTGRVAFWLMIDAMIMLPLGIGLWIRRRAWM
jgi:Mg2+ and Co2+ transporter CorA